MGFILWFVVGFFCGSIPFSLITGRIARKVDIREIGDHNPGAYNVMRAAGWRWGFAALLLDYLKGAIPVGLAWFWAGLDGWGLIAIALSPVLGHAFSPWLNFRGGKAVATSFGVWTGLTLGTGPILLGLMLGIFFLTLQSSGWAVIISFMLFGWFVKSYFAPVFVEFSFIWLGNLTLLLWKHRQELTTLPEFRSSTLSALKNLMLWRGD